MLRLVETLWRGSQARMEEATTDRFAIELIEQKVREAQGAFRAAKATLATLMQRERVESRALSALDTQIADLMERARLALADGREDLAHRAATAIADLENERTVRRDTLDRLDAKCARLRHSLDRANRRIIDLKQGLIGARAVDRERKAQSALGRGIATPHMAEAEELIARVMGADDPFERADITAQIDADLSHTDIAAQMGDAGYGPKARSTAADVLSRLKTTPEKE